MSGNATTVNFDADQISVIFQPLLTSIVVILSHPLLHHKALSLWTRVANFQAFLLLLITRPSETVDFSAMWQHH
ncbi:unnamed protein product [Cochlearia groenlandica]